MSAFEWYSRWEVPAVSTAGLTVPLLVGVVRTGPDREVATQYGTDGPLALLLGDTGAAMVRAVRLSIGAREERP
ncbi:hypothetical protein [Amycolatopsis nigrescens]|uniref:hypothetical protein n=1 Tax=Amycolatopsis nigrescens TaxID=381445 RepID=UPI00035D7746|nr:hypothetical protein [Amycolatopsis nigrescens]